MNNKLLKYYLKLVLIFVTMSPTAFTQTNYWELAGNPSSNAISNIVFAPNGHLFAGTSGTFHLYKSTDYGTTWNQIDTNTGAAFKYTMTVSPISGTIIIAGADTIYHSTDEGASWMSIPYNKSIMNLSSDSNGYFFAGTPINGPIRSTDDGLTWESHYSGLTQFSIYSFAFKDSEVVFTSSYRGAVYKSTNNGELWTPIPIGCFGDVLSLVAQKNGYLFAGTNGNGVYSTSDNGDNWININNGLSNNIVQSLCLNNRQHLFAGTSRGIFRTVDFGEVWIEISTGLSNLNVSSLAIGPDGRIFAATQSGKVFRSVGSTTSTEQYTLEQINIFSLSQNYPNPFNPTTTFSFNLSSPSFVSLKVFDFLGNEIACIISEELPAGSHSKQWDASNISSGIYFFRFNAGSFSETKKLIILK